MYLESSRIISSNLAFVILYHQVALFPSVIYFQRGRGIIRGTRGPTKHNQERETKQHQEGRSGVLLDGTRAGDWNLVVGGMKVVETMGRGRVLYDIVRCKGRATTRGRYLWNPLEASTSR